MKIDELDQKLLDNWEHLTENEKALLRAVGLNPELKEKKKEKELKKLEEKENEKGRFATVSE